MKSSACPLTLAAIAIALSFGCKGSSDPFHGHGGGGALDAGAHDAGGSQDDASDAAGGADAGSDAADGEAEMDATDAADTTDADAGSVVRDCTRERWGDVSDACFNCLCSTCGGLMNNCNEGCLGILQCSIKNDLLVSVPADLSCEGRAVLSGCLKDPAAQAAVGSLIYLDGCLINEHTEPQEKLRACEAECGIQYTDDVCTRYPASP